MQSALSGSVLGIFFGLSLVACTPSTTAPTTTAPTSAAAQGTIAERLAAMGGTIVLKDEWISLLPASRRGRPTSYNSGGAGVAYVIWKADGTLGGEYKLDSGPSSEIVGTWTMDATGKLCINERFPKFGPGSTWSDCRYVYRVGEKYLSVFDPTAKYTGQEAGEFQVRQ